MNCKTYELIQKYPSLDKTWEVGMKIYNDNCGLCYIPRNKKYTQYGLSIAEAENYPEFWQEVVEKEYEIIEVINGGNILLRFNCNGICVYRSDNVDLSLAYTLKDVLKVESTKINCVRRLSDNQLFYVGEETNFGKIKGFKIEKNGMWVLYLNCCSQKLMDVQHVNEKFEIIDWKITDAKPLHMIGALVPDMWIIGFQCISKTINSVKRDVDQQIFSVGDMVKDHENSIRLKIKSFTIRKKQLATGRHFFGEDLIWVDYEGNYMGNWLNNIIKLEQKPIFITEDGIDIFKGDEYYCVHFTDTREVQPSFNKIPLFKIYGPNKAFKETENIHYTKDAKYFSTEEAAQVFIDLNFKKPLFTTEDGIEIFEEDVELFCVSSDEYILQSQYLGTDDFARGIFKETINYKGILKSNRYGYYYFTSKERAQEYIKLNKPRYSLQDILNARLNYTVPEVGAITIDFEELENKK